MGRFRKALRKLTRRTRDCDDEDRRYDREIQRLSAEYDGCWGRNVGHECGIVPGRYTGR